MKKHQTRRNATSRAIIALRRAYGMTQTTFAVDVLKIAVATVARWETSHPPTGKTLLKLADIARERASTLFGPTAEPFYTLDGVFRGLYADEFMRNIQRQHKAVSNDYCLFIPETATGGPALYRFSRRVTPAAINAEAGLLKELKDEEKLASLGGYILSLHLEKNK
jgi:transcriptional regulator with XRE-family HTH domain